VPNLSMNFEEILSLAYGTFEEQHRVVELSIIIINHCIIINAYYNCNYIIKSWYNYISNKGLRQKSSKEENVAVIGADTTSCLTLRLLMSYIYIYIYIWSTYS